MFKNEKSMEERKIILRDKAAREHIQIGDDVIEFIAQKFSVPQALKGALINVSAYAFRRQLPITVDLASHVLDGTRFSVGLSDEELSAEELAPEELPIDIEPEPPLDDPLFEAEPAPQPLHDQATLFDEPSFLQGFEPALSLEDADEPIFIEPAPSSVPSPEPAPVTEPESPLNFSPEQNPSPVWFVPMRTTRKKSLIDRVGMAAIRAGLSDIIDEGDKVAIKVHVGEHGNTAFVSPIYIREIVRLIKVAGGKPFITDANTLYSGMRDNAVEHIACGIENGFSFATIGAPFIIADGLVGRDGEDIKLSGTKHFDTVRIGSAAVHADAMIVISHVKGHGESGFGGAFKNVGMGLGTRSAKQRMHSSIKPHVDQENCTRCGRCVEWCPVNCIDMGPTPQDKAFIRQEECIGCGECVAACAFDAIKINWKTDASEFQEKIVEHTLGALKNKKDKTLFISFMTNITPECDCWKFSDAAIVPDIGVLASRDIVAIDQAAVDMITKATGNAHSAGEGMESGTDKFKAMHNIDVSVTMRYAEELGMGSRSYTIKEID